MNLKVPFRSIICDTPWAWLKEVFWCFVVLKIYPYTVSLYPIDGHPELCPWCLSVMNCGPENGKQLGQGKHGLSRTVVGLDGKKRNTNSNEWLDAEEIGYQHGKEDMPNKNPFDSDTKSFQEYDAGYEKGWNEKEN